MTRLWTIRNNDYILRINNKFDIKIKIILIAIICFVFATFKSNGQTLTKQKLDKEYPYYFVFFDKEKITEQLYSSYGEIKRKELSVKYETEIADEEMYTSTVTVESIHIVNNKLEAGILKLKDEVNNKKQIDSLYKDNERLEKIIEENRLKEIRKKIEKNK
jgi:hypothetical protein